MLPFNFLGSLPHCNFHILIFLYNGRLESIVLQIMTRWRADISVWNERGYETCCLLPGNTRKFGMDYSWTMYIFRNWLGIQQICSETNYEIRLATVHKQNIVNSGSNNWVIGTHYRDATYKQPLRAIITIFASSIIMG